MSALIKRGADQDGVRAFSHAASPAGISHTGRHAPATPPRAAPTQEERLALEQEILALRQALDEAERRHQDELEAVETRTREETLRAFADQEKHRLELMRVHIGEALQIWRRQLETIDILALSLCHSALDRLLADPAQKMALLKDALAHQLEGLKRESIISVSLSPKDFSEDALRRLASELGTGLKFTLDPTLGSAACRIALRLGRLEFSLPQHRETLDALWRRLSEGVGS